MNYICIRKKQVRVADNSILLSHCERLARTKVSSIETFYFMQKNDKCIIDGCTNHLKTNPDLTVKLVRGYCKRHYAKFIKYGDPLYIFPFARPDRCKIDGCNGAGKLNTKTGKREFVKGYCLAHYGRFRTYGDPHIIKTMRGVKKCMIDGCNGVGRMGGNGLRSFTKGYCERHYQKFMKYGDPLHIESIVGENRGKHPLYMTYHAMKDRCYNPTTEGYKYYGERGIKVCNRWLGLRGFDAFCKDVGDRPSEKHSIDRIDVNGNYEPTNCRWSLAKEQCRNKTNTIYVKYKNKKRVLIELCEELNIPTATIYSRIFHCGWSVNKAINTPIGSPKLKLKCLQKKEQSIYSVLNASKNRPVKIKTLLKKYVCNTEDDYIRQGKNLQYDISKIRRKKNCVIKLVNNSYMLIK